MIKVLYTQANCNTIAYAIFPINIKAPWARSLVLQYSYIHEVTTSMDTLLLVESTELQNDVNERSINYQHCLRDPAASARFLHHLEADNTEGIRNNRLNLLRC